MVNLDDFSNQHIAINESISEPMDTADVQTIEAQFNVTDIENVLLADSSTQSEFNKSEAVWHVSPRHDYWNVSTRENYWLVSPRGDCWDVLLRENYWTVSSRKDYWHNDD